MSKNQGLFLICEECGIKKHIHPYQKETARFCSTNCYINYVKSHRNYKKYKRINGQCEHRLLAAKALGRTLTTDIPIHHLEGGFSGPIVICQNDAYHSLLHKRTRALIATGDPHKVKCCICHTWDDPENLTIAKRKSYHKKCNTEYERNRRVKEARI